MVATCNLCYYFRNRKFMILLLFIWSISISLSNIQERTGAGGHVNLFFCSFLAGAITMFALVLGMSKLNHAKNIIQLRQTNFCTVTMYVDIFANSMHGVCSRSYTRKIILIAICTVRLNINIDSICSSTGSIWANKNTAVRFSSTRKSVLCSRYHMNYYSTMIAWTWSILCSYSSHGVF